jgi:hypothetical protein
MSHIKNKSLRKVVNIVSHSQYKNQKRFVSLLNVKLLYRYVSLLKYKVLYMIASLSDFKLLRRIVSQIKSKLQAFSASLRMLKPLEEFVEVVKWIN